MKNQKEKIDIIIKELKEIYTAKRSEDIDPELGEATIIISQAFLDGMKYIIDIAIPFINDLEREVVEEPSQKPPKELAEFKIEVLKDIRKTIRESFSQLSGTMQSSKDSERLQSILMKIDRKFINHISSIRPELPVNNDSTHTDHGSAINHLIKTGQIRI